MHNKFNVKLNIFRHNAYNCHNMSISSVSCILHHPSHPSSETEITIFNDTTWLKVKHANKQRRQYLKESKYFDIHLPDHFTESCGYHQQCYKVFTAVPKVPLLLKGSEGNQIKQHVMQSDVQHPSTSCSSGVFEKTCIFCNAST